MNKRKNTTRRRSLIASILCAPFAAVGYLCKFVLPGYSFSAMVCLGVICLILFYALLPTLGSHYPMAAKWLFRGVTVVLCLFLAAALVTEGFILKASFGHPRQKVDYLVVLGAKVRVTGPSASLWDRIYGAYDYLIDHPDTIAVVSGGQGDDEHISEAQSMYEELVKLGIPADHIWLEDKSTSTLENLNFSLDVIEARTGSRPTRLGVVSSEYHMLRASLIAKDCGVKFVGIPAQTSRLGQLINHCMREIPAVWKQLLVGGNGNG